MKEEIFIALLVIFVGFMGLSFSLMQIYSSPDGNSYPFNASLIYLGTSIFMFTFLLTLKQDIPKVMKWINIVLILAFGILAILLALICLYAAPIENKVYPLASAIFVVSGMISFSSIFMIGKFVVEISNNTLERNI
jgi:hypothetical protein